MNYKKEGEIVIIDVDRNINSLNIKDFRSIMDEIRENDYQKIIINFHNIDFIISETLGVLVSVLKRVRVSGGDIVICGIGDKLIRIFQLTRLDKVIEIVDNIEDAKKIF